MCVCGVCVLRFALRCKPLIEHNIVISFCVNESLHFCIWVKGLSVIPIAMLKVHADVLRLAETREKRESIKWHYARGHYSLLRAFAEFLALARQCQHEDALFLLSLLPEGMPETAEAAREVFVKHDEDARCQCWAALCESDPAEAIALLTKSAERGYAWGQYFLAKTTRDAKLRAQLMERAAEQGDRDALFEFGEALWSGSRDNETRKRALNMWHQSALLGCAFAQVQFAFWALPDFSLEQLVWFRRVLLQHEQSFVICKHLQRGIMREMGLYCSGGSGRIVFELGEIFLVAPHWCDRAENSIQGAGKWVLDLHAKWCVEAKLAILCWMWLSRDKNVVKDIRLKIANLIWDERAVWSERKR